MTMGPKAPSAYWEEKCEWYHVVPYVSAMNVYVKVFPGAIGHWVMPGTPSIHGVPFCRKPCQCTDVPSTGALMSFLTLTSIVSPLYSSPLESARIWSP